tara:strand:- start:129 stop:464 length:336 start_codon:yes stop_codon:yes gene_type:complete
MVKYNKTTLQNYIQQTNGDTMSTKSFRSTPLPAVSRPLSCASDFWIAQQQRQQLPSNLVWGRIQDNGCNFIVEGYRQGEWVKIPCRTLLDAKLLLGYVMSRLDFELAKIGQ